MDNIRKISVGPDYKGSSMHYILGQKVLGDTSEIELIRFDEVKNSIKIFIRNSEKNESLLWKEFNFTMPIAIEYNINF
jgi:hypothetical protein